MGTIDRTSGDLPSAEKALHRALLELSEVDAEKHEKEARTELEIVLAAKGRGSPIDSHTHADHR